MRSRNTNWSWMTFWILEHVILCFLLSDLSMFTGFTLFYLVFIEKLMNKPWFQNNSFQSNESIRDENANRLLESQLWRLALSLLCAWFTYPRSGAHTIKDYAKYLPRWLMQPPWQCICVHKRHNFNFLPKKLIKKISYALIWKLLIILWYLFQTMIKMGYIELNEKKSFNQHSPLRYFRVFQSKLCNLGSKLTT